MSCRTATLVSAANSLVGSSAGDNVGGSGGSGVTLLANGNYVVRSPVWDNGAIGDAGAVTWGSGTAGIQGTISDANSLPVPLRAQLISLAEFVRRHSLAVLAGRARLGALIDINTAIMKGLRGNLEAAA